MPIETIVHTIRHGHTSYNAEKRYAGMIDISLSDEGVKSCKEASLKLTGYAFDVIVTSALKRSIETAQLLVPGHPVIAQTPLCNERGFGVMEGRTWDDVLKFDPPVLMIEVGNDLHTVNPEGGEPFEDVWHRAKRFRTFLFKNFKGKKILVVSHSVFLQMFHGVLRDSNCIESLASYLPNLELSSFYFSGSRLLNTKNIKLNQNTSGNF